MDEVIYKYPDQVCILIEDVLTPNEDHKYISRKLSYEDVVFDNSEFYEYHDDSVKNGEHVIKRWIAY